MKWRPIHTAPLKDKKPFIVWLPESKMAVSAMPCFNYADDDNTPVSIDWWSMTDRAGAFYGLHLDEQPSHWLDGLHGPED